ncbi:MAG: hypothetical protein ACFFB5_20170 [Promethearchaeota archaeon]
MSRIQDILDIEKELEQETETHLHIKADLSRKLSELSTEELALTNQVTSLQERISKGEIKDSTKSFDILQLIETKTQLESEIQKLQEEITPFEQQLAHLNSEGSIIKSKIEALKREKQELEAKVLEIERKQAKNKRASNKVQNERERLNKIRKRIGNQIKIKDNLEIFLKTLNVIQEVVSTYSPLTESKIPLTVTEEIYEQIINSKKKFDEAQTSFDPNNLVPFLIDADESYRNIVSAFIKLCDNIPNSLLEKEFSQQILTLVDKGFVLNTRHLNAVQSMLSKLEKGVEIAPLASFSNEIKTYFVENLTYFRVTGWVILEPPPS